MLPNSTMLIFSLVVYSGLSTGSLDPAKHVVQNTLCVQIDDRPVAAWLTGGIYDATPPPTPSS